MPTQNVYGCNANLLLNTSPPDYAPFPEGGSVRWYEDRRWVTTRGELIAIGPPLPVKSKILGGILKWSNLGASTAILGVGDQFSSNRYKLTQPTGWASCEAIQRFDGLDVGGMFGVQPGTGAVSFGADTFANPDNDGFSTCSMQIQVSVSYAGTAAPAGVVYCGFMVAQANP